MDVKKDEIESFKKLRSEFNKLEPIPHYTPTLIEISGYPHYEDVMSNVLCFFFSADFKHGFSSLFVEALLDASGENYEFDSSDTLVSNVERELLTEAGNRIDLVIETEAYCIAIEHKIYADLYNDLSEYEESIESYSQKKKIYIVLAKNLKDFPEKEEKHQFNLVTYEGFFFNLEKRLGSQIAKADSKVLMYIGDFIKTIRNLNKKTNMSEEFLKFLADYTDDIESLYEHAFQDFKNEIRTKAKAIDEYIELSETEFQRFHYNPQDKLKYVQGYKNNMAVKNGEFELKVKLRLRPDRYELELWSPNSSEHELFKKFIMEDFFIDSTKPDWEKHDNNKKVSISIEEDLEYGKDSKKVASRAQELIDKIETSVSG